MVRFIIMLGEFLLSYRFSIDTAYQSGFADGWSKPHPYGIDGAFFAQPTARSTQRVGGLMSPPYDGLPAKQQFIWLPRHADQHWKYFPISRWAVSTSSCNSRADILSTPLRKLDSCTRESEEATRTA